MASDTAGGRTNPLVSVDESTSTKNVYVDAAGNYTGKIFVYKLGEKGMEYIPLGGKGGKRPEAPPHQDGDLYRTERVTPADPQPFGIPVEPPAHQEAYQPDAGYAVIHQSEDGRARHRVAVNVSNAGVSLATWYDFVHIDSFVIVLGIQNAGPGSFILQFDKKKRLPVEITIDENPETYKVVYLADLKLDNWTLQILLRDTGNE